jgi:phospholipid transport system substrate-binding protein
MLTRRSLVIGSVLGAAWLAAGRIAWAQGGQAADATHFIDDLGRRLINVVNEGGGTETKKQQMRPLIDQAVAVDQIGQFVLGQYWRIATASQQQEFLKLFHEVLVTNVSSKLGEFKGVSYQMTKTEQRGSEYYVGTTITRPNQQPNNVQWVVSFASGKPQVIDVVAEGTSLRLTQRSDYASYLSRNGNNVDALLTALQRQAAA